MDNQPASGIAPREFSITRVFSAPRDLVWKAWSEPARMAQWWGPKGCDLQVKKLEFRSGGVFHYSMQMPGGRDTWWARFVYREIVKPERIVFVSSFSDENAGLARAPFSPAWPLEVLNHVMLSDQSGKTALTLRGGPINASGEEQESYEGMFGSMQQGFGNTFDQLDEHLAKT